MTRGRSTLDRDYFEALYAGSDDPWRFRTSTYEAEKYAATLAALPRDVYASALEVGCAIGVFTRQLAPRCQRLLAIDTSDKALAAARRECAGEPGVAFLRATVPDEFPDGHYDLIVLSEVLYYLAPGDLRALADRCLASLDASGAVILCHWLGETDYPLTGDEAADIFLDAAVTRLPVRRAFRRSAYRIDVLSEAETPLHATA